MPHPLRASCAWGLTIACLLTAGCRSLAFHEVAQDPAISIDGLELPADATSTTREVVSMLALDGECRRPNPDCAERILDAPGTVRTATRLAAASDILFLYGRHAEGAAQGAAFSRCGVMTHRYLFQPGLDGREGPLVARSHLVLRRHNACTAGLALRIADQPQLLHWAVDEHRFPRSAVVRIELAERLRVSGLRTRQVSDGIGVPAVAVGQTREPSGVFPAQPFALAINIRLVVDEDGAARLVATSAAQEQQVDTVFGPTPLAHDMSAAYAHAAVLFEDELTAWESLRGTAPGDGGAQIRLLAPVDEHKTPVLLVHGFASSPLTWANMVNELLGDPAIFRNYQFWMVRYPTGRPLLVNRKDLGGRIDGFRERAFPSGAAPPLVIVGHSMGGVLARLLVTDSGQALWDAAFDATPQELQGSQEDIAAARDLFVFEPLAGVDEVVFIAAPHGGSSQADGRLARLVKRLMRGPGAPLAFLARLASNNPGQVRESVRENYFQGGPDSLDTLSPKQPVIRAGRSLPISPGVHVHSIIGVEDPAKPEEGDGVVTLDSARWPSGSEYIVRGGHDLQVRPETIAILKTILLDRLR